MERQGPVGGSPFHKNPDCKCDPCSARRRKEEAIALAIREGRPPPTKKSHQGIVNADLPDLISPGRTPRARVAQWMAMRAAEPGIKNKEVAKRLGLTPQTLNGYIGLAGKQGWLKFEDPIERINHEIIPKVVDNLSLFLDQKDKQVTIETAKGTIFKVFQESEGVNEGNQTILALKIETAEPLDVKVISSHVVGKAKELPSET